MYNIQLEVKIVIIIIVPEMEQPLTSAWCPTLIRTMNPVAARVRDYSDSATKGEDPDRKSATHTHDEYTETKKP